MLPFSTLVLGFGIILKKPCLVTSYDGFLVDCVFFVFINEVLAMLNSKQFLVISQFVWNKPRTNLSQSEMFGQNVMNCIWTYSIPFLYNATKISALFLWIHAQSQRFLTFTADLGRPERRRHWSLPKLLEIIARHVPVHVFDFILTHSKKIMIIELAWCQLLFFHSLGGGTIKFQRGKRFGHRCGPSSVPDFLLKTLRCQDRLRK